VAGPEKGAITGKHGYSVEADMAFADVDAPIWHGAQAVVYTHFGRFD